MSFHITGLDEADRVLDDYPFAIVVGMLLDQQYGMEHAFRGGWKILGRVGTLDPAAIAAMDPEHFTRICVEPPAIHRYGRAMAARVQALAQVVATEYGGDVTRLWTTAKTGAELVARIEALPGFGNQKARIFVAFLAKQLNVRPRGWKQVAGDYALNGYRSVADVTGTESLRKVRETKKLKKAQAAAQGV